MSASHNISIQSHEFQHQKSRLDNVLPQNQELINNLNLKIDRRINNGYYYQVAAKRKTLPLPNRYKFQPKSKPKKVHPVIKKPRKINEKISVVDQQQNTDEVDFCEKWQNTSGIYVLKEPDAILEDEQMQFSCEITEIQQKNQSMQWSIEPIQQFHEEVQYTLQSQIVLIECRDASIQYSFEQPQPEPQPIPEPVPEIKKVFQDAEMQVERIKNAQIQIQYNEPLPETKQKHLQADLPDLKQLNLISAMENRMKYLKHEQRKQLKLQKKKEREIQILKLKQIMEKLEGKIELASEKEEYLKKKAENQLLLREKERKFKLQKQMLRQQAEKHYNSKLELLLSKLKQGYKRLPINSSFKEDEQKRLAEIERLEKLSKQELENYKKQVDELKKNLKEEMFKRLNYQNESDDDTAAQQGQKDRLNSQSFKRGSGHDISMDNLFPNLKNRYAGMIIKNINSDQRKLNDHQIAQKMGRSYWRSKSPFEYEFEQASTVRMNRKYSYLQKVSQKKIDQIDISSENPELPGNPSPNRSRAKLNFNHPIEERPKIKYRAQKITFQWEQLKQIKQDFDDLFGDEDYFRYLYAEEDKIKLGIKLFQILKVHLDEKMKKSVKIYKSLKFIAFEHSIDQNIQFIIFYHNKSVISGVIPLQNTNHQFYESPHKFKNGEVFQYLCQNQIFQGFYQNGQKEGYGILSNLCTYYEGDFSAGKKSGFGKLTLENGDIYKGQFQSNHFEGEGIYVWSNGQKYDGYFREGLKHGWGKHYFKNGDVYEGQYKTNKRDGKGTYKWKDGNVYQGNFLNDQKYKWLQYRCGQGRLELANGNSVLGQWRSDQIVEGAATKPLRGRSREDLPLLSKIKVSK